jgi:hypothetical protein
MTNLTTSRRTALSVFGAGALATTLVPVSSAVAGGSSRLLPANADAIKKLAVRLEKVPRRRDFKTVPMVLDHPDQWDQEALTEVMKYQGSLKQVWDQTELDSPWLNLMRNSMNTQIWSFGHKDFLAVSATHGSAHLALFDQDVWDKYALSEMTDGKLKSNTLIEDSRPDAKADDYQDDKGPDSSAGNNIPTLMRRGVVFMACHNAIWELSAKLFKGGNNPDHLSQDQFAAELTNHLIPDVVLSPGVVGTIPELQRFGFHYIK